MAKQALSKMRNFYDQRKQTKSLKKKWSKILYEVSCFMAQRHGL